jgi:hypothetical protein
MLEELGRIKHSGRKEDILFFLQKVVGPQQLSEKDIRAISKHSSGAYQLNVDFLLPYCLYIGMVKVVNDRIMLSDDTVKYVDDYSKLNHLIISKSINILFEVQLFKADMFKYDVFYDQFIFKNEQLPLPFAEFRNVLEKQGFFDIYRVNGVTKFAVNRSYENLISSHCRPQKRTMGIEQLKRELEDNSKAGEKAELFVVGYERKRIANQSLAKRVRIISDIDVCAGYDIISFDSSISNNYDRFIEVKAISCSKAFYWSINELNTAKLKGNQYYLYLVDLQRTLDDNYEPDIISNPSDFIFNSGEWFVEPQTFQVRKV